MRDLILSHTVVTPARLCPEIRLQLITSECPLWRATEEDAARAGLVEPYWAFSWAGGQALARYVLDHPEIVRGKSVLDFGAGGAVEGIAAALSGASVLAADIDPMAVEAARLNAELSGATLDTTTEDLVGNVDRHWDVVLAGDVFYGTEMARPTLAWLAALASRGTTVLIGDPDRGFLDTSGLARVARYEAPEDYDADGSFLRPTTIYRVGVTACRLRAGKSELHTGSRSDAVKLLLHPDDEEELFHHAAWYDADRAGLVSFNASSTARVDGVHDRFRGSKRTRRLLRAECFPRSAGLEAVRVPRRDVEDVQISGVVQARGEGRHRGVRGFDPHYTGNPRR